MNSYDVAVIGAGVFGSWTAWHLAQSGKSVLLLDAYGPAHSRSSSGGESRIIRMGYGKDEIYTAWSQRSLTLWQEFFQRIARPLFHRTGVLWLVAEGDTYAEQTLAVFQKLGIEHEKMSRSEMENRYPQFDFGETAWGILEPNSGAVMARQAVQSVVEDAVKNGVIYLRSLVKYDAEQRSIVQITAGDLSYVPAETLVFAGGPWLPKIFPELLGSRIFPTRQEVFFFATPAGDQQFSPPALPIWIDNTCETYGLPDLEGRGLKVAQDQHGPRFDPETGDRVATAEGLRQAQDYVSKRFPALKGARVVESQVRQYENSSSGDFLIDRHPEDDRIWLVGGGSGHGFKHGPAIGEYVAARIAGHGAIEPRFSLDSKATVQKRTVF
ncbi:MAG TPA: FAD-dependent oxidoreductase [Terriglobia bacterium]|nr:FAD-dependent oxidoreductase [Terriglobia bacterium]